jgi:hypothetical protein
MPGKYGELLDKLKKLLADKADADKQSDEYATQSYSFKQKSDAAHRLAADLNAQVHDLTNELYTALREGK